MDNIKTYSIPIKNITFEQEKNPQFLKTKFYAISEGQNLNKSNFVLEGIQECLANEDYAHKPILGAWDSQKITQNGIGNFLGHESSVAIDAYDGEAYDTYLGEHSERPLGLILPNSGKIESYNGKQWLTFEGLLWTKYNREVVTFLKKKRKNNVSVEISVIDSETKDDGIEYIKKFTLLGITIIGVDAGIPNACLNILDFAKTPKYDNFVRAFSAESVNNEKKEVSKMQTENFKQELGTGEALTLDLSKESASNDNWGDISKTDLRNKLLAAKNYKSLIPKSYLIAEDGWEEAPSEKLKYPVVQIKGGKVVLNINGVQAASSYLMKEKDRDYFKTARAKLNRLRTTLGMEKLFGIETNDDWGVPVSEDQPTIIKMEDRAKMNAKKKELVEKLSELFAKKEQSLAKKTELEKAYEDKMGEVAFAEDDVKEPLKKEVDLAKQAVDDIEKEMAKTDGEISAMACDLVGIEKAEKEPAFEVEPDGETSEPKEEEEALKMGCHEYASGSEYLTHTKNYVVYTKGADIFARKFSMADGKATFAAEEVKVDKVYATFLTGGNVTQNDTLGFPPVLVEVKRGLDSRIDGLRKQLASKIAESGEYSAKYEQLKKDFDAYKTNIVEYTAKFNEISAGDKLDKTFAEEVMRKIYGMEYKSIPEMQMEVKSKLYDSGKSKYIGGYFPNQNNSSGSTKKSDQEVYDEIIKQYKNKI